MLVTTLRWWRKQFLNCRRRKVTNVTVASTTFVKKLSPKLSVTNIRQHRIFVLQKSFGKLSLAKAAWARTNPKSFIFRFLQKNLLFVQSLFWKIWFFRRFDFIIKKNFGESRDKNTTVRGGSHCSSFKRFPAMFLRKKVRVVSNNRSKFIYNFTYSSYFIPDRQNLNEFNQIMINIKLPLRNNPKIIQLRWAPDLYHIVYII